MIGKEQSKQSNHIIIYHHARGIRNPQKAQTTVVTDNGTIVQLSHVHTCTHITTNATSKL